ncbi:MAG: hypothetical protein KGR25_10455 [Chloroflexi bacterium]|nr:hypothetical protein [Chloroflexota bacterium]
MKRPAIFRVKNIDWNVAEKDTSVHDNPRVVPANLPDMLRIEVSELGPCELWHGQIPDDFIDVILKKVNSQTGWLINDCDIDLLDGGE